MFVKSGGVEEDEEDEDDNPQSQRLTSFLQTQGEGGGGAGPERPTTASTIVVGFKRAGPEEEDGDEGESVGDSNPHEAVMSRSRLGATASPIRTQRPLPFEQKQLATSRRTTKGPSSPAPKGLVGALATSARDGLRMTGDFMSGLDFQALFSTLRGRSGHDGDDLDNSLPDDLDGSQNEEEEDDDGIHRLTWRPTNAFSLQRKDATAKIAPEGTLARAYRDPKEGRLRRRSIDRSGGETDDDA